MEPKCDWCSSTLGTIYYVRKSWDTEGRLHTNHLCPICAYTPSSFLGNATTIVNHYTGNFLALRGNKVEEVHHA